MKKVIVRRPDRDVMSRMLLISLAVHIGLAVFLSIGPWHTFIKARPTVYTVNLVPLSLPSPEVSKPATEATVKPETQKPVDKAKPAEKAKPVEKAKKEDIVEKAKKPPKKLEEPKENKESLKRLQEALEEIRKKAALDEIRKKLAKAEAPTDRPATPPPTTPAVIGPPSRTPVASTTQTTGRPDSRLGEYYSLVWAKIKEAWTIPENLVREKIDLEAVIVIVIERDGRVQRSWFERRSGNDLYDQMAMRAIKKADPLPPIPRELGESSMEVGLRFIEE